MKKLLVIQGVLALSLLAQKPVTEDDLLNNVARKVRHGDTVPSACSDGMIFREDDAEKVYFCGTGNTFEEFTGSAIAGGMVITSGAGAPPGTCTAYVDWYVRTSNAHVNACVATNTWADITQPALADTATALAANPSDCGANTFANTIAANGNLTCAAVALAALATQAADTVVLNATGGAAAPTAVALPTTGTNGCAGATDALTYNTTSHALGCNQITGGTGDAAAEITTTCSGATVTFTGTSNTSNGFKCVLVATNVTSSTLAGLTTGQTNTISITQPAGGGITFAAITGLTGFTPITTGAGDAANEVCSVAFKADSATTGHVVGVQNCNGGTPGITIPGSTSGSMTIVAPATGGGTVTGPTGAQTLLGNNATNIFGTAGTLNMSAATNDEALRVPNVAGAANTSDGAISYDTTNKNLHAGTNGADGIVPIVASTPTNGNCPKWVVSSSKVSLSNDTCSSGSSGVSLLDYQKETTAVAISASDVTVWTTSVTGGLGAGKCLKIWAYFTQTGVNIDKKIWVGATSWTMFTANNTAGYWMFTIHICNDPGSQTSQQLTVPPFYLEGAGLYPPNGSMANVTQTGSEDLSSTFTLKWTSNGAGGSVTPKYWRVERDN